VYVGPSPFTATEKDLAEKKPLITRPLRLAGPNGRKLRSPERKPSLQSYHLPFSPNPRRALRAGYVRMYAKKHRDRIGVRVQTRKHLSLACCQAGYRQNSTCNPVSAVARETSPHDAPPPPGYTNGRRISALYRSTAITVLCMHAEHFLPNGNPA
jgi:hypothetical protein